ncbi:hypothetical protein [Arenimonas sp.]|jgi:hypothetical protein|uniref:hypothetical protein n=1 Tax=Arenimonas sp. TaxID=1872635 RepID=UPI0037BF2B14
MRRLFVHIGSHKAGSTALQDSLLANRGSDTGFRFLHHPRLRTHSVLAAMYKPFDTLDHTIRLQMPDPEAVALVRRNFWQRIPEHFPDADNAVLSSEYLSAIDADAVRRFRSDVEAMGYGRFRILLYVREATARYASGIQQAVKFRDDLPRMDPRLLYFNFREQIETWESVFPGDVEVRAFERGQLLEGCVVADAYSRISEFFGIATHPDKRVDSNRSMSSETLFCLYNLYRHLDTAQFSPDQVRIQTGLYKQIETLVQASMPAPSRITLRPAVARMVYERHRADYDWLAQHYGVRFQEPTIPAETAEEAPLRLSDPPGLPELVLPPDARVLIQLLGKIAADGLFRAR